MTAVRATSWLPEGVSPPRQERGWVAFDRVLDACDRVCREGGRDALTMANISVESGVSANSIHRWFGSRGQLLATVLARQILLLDQFLLDTAQAVRSKRMGTLELVDTIVRAYVDLCVREGYDLRIRDEVESDFPEMAQRRMDADGRVMTAFAEVLVQCPGMENLKNPVEEARFHAAVVGSVVRRSMSTGEPELWASENLEELTDRLVGMVHRSLVGLAEA